MADDIQDIETWLDQFKHPKALIGRVAKRFLLHRADIEQDFDTMEDDWKNQMYLQSGEAMADLIVSAIGPVEATDDDYELDLKAVPDFLAGFMFQVTGDNKMTEIEQCYQNGDKLVVDAQSVLSDIAHGHFISGIQDIGQIVWDMPDAFSKCTGMDDDVAELKAWGAEFTDVAHLTKSVAKNWLLHGTKVKEDIAQEQADWSDSKYFDAGKDTAAAIEILVPLPKTDGEILFPVM